MALNIPEIEDITEDEVRSEVFDLVNDDEVLPDVSNQNSGGVMRRLAELFGKGQWKVYDFFAQEVLPKAYWRTCSGTWLDAKGREVMLERISASKATHNVTFTRSETSGNMPVPEGGVVSTAFDVDGNRLRFITKAAAVAGDGEATISVEVEAMEPGAAHNVGSGTITEMVTAFPGWDSVTNESDSLVSEGNDEEVDGRELEPGEPNSSTSGLRRRIGLQWMKGNNCNWAAYTALALEAGATDVVVKQLRGAGTVDVYIVGPAGIPTDELKAAVEAKLGDETSGLPATDDWVVWKPTAVAQDYELELIMNPGEASDTSAIQTTALSILNALHNPSTTMDGVEPFKIGQDVILDFLFFTLRRAGLGGLKSITWTSPATDQTLTVGQLATIGAAPVITVSEASEE